MDFASSSLAKRALNREFNIFNFLNFSDFNRLKAVKSTSSFLLGASSHVECGDKALGVVDSTVLLADTHVLRLSNIDINWVFLKAFKTADSLGLGASLEITSRDHAYA